LAVGLPGINVLAGGAALIVVFLKQIDEPQMMAA
jgi:hypothetical protein